MNIYITACLKEYIRGGAEMTFGTKYKIEILYEPKYGRGAEITKLIQDIARSQGFAELEFVKKLIPDEEGRSYPEQKQYWVHMSKAHRGVEWRHSLVGINYNIIASKIDLDVSAVGEHAHDIWASMVKQLRDREDVRKITIKEIESWGPGESLRDGPIIVK